MKSTILAMLTLSLALFAQEEIEEYTITATRVKTPLEKTGSATTTITAEEIQERKIHHIADILRIVPGLEVSQTSWGGKLTSVFLRGAASQHTLVLVDGIPVNSPTTGMYDFATLTVDNIERVEIVRGGQSTLYGSEAMGGVINIITRKGKDKPSTSISSEYGEFNTWLDKLQVAGQHRVSADVEFDYSASFSYLKTQGISAASREKGNYEKDGYKNFTGSARIGFNLPAYTRVDLFVRGVNAETEIDGWTFGVGPTDDPNYIQYTNALYAGIQLKRSIYEKLDLSLKLSTVLEELQGDDPDTGLNNWLIETRRDRVELQTEFFPLDYYNCVAGIGYELQEADSRGNFDEKRYLRWALLENLFAIADSLFITLGARYDDYLDFGNKSTWRLTIAYPLKQTGTHLRGSISTGFRAPSLNELYYPFYGNPDLEAEKSQGFDVGVEQKIFEEQLKIGASYFDIRFDDLIATDPLTWTAKNIKEARSLGIELWLKSQPANFLILNASFTYNPTKDEQEDDPLPRRPLRRGSLNLTLRPFESFYSMLEMVVVSKRIDTNGSKMDNYALFNAAVEYQVSQEFKVYIRAQNIFNREYEEITGYTSAGAAVFFGVNFGL